MVHDCSVAYVKASAVSTPWRFFPGERRVTGGPLGRRSGFCLMRLGLFGLREDVGGRHVVNWRCRKSECGRGRGRRRGEEAGTNRRLVRFTTASHSPFPRCSRCNRARAGSPAPESKGPSPTRTTRLKRFQRRRRRSALRCWTCVDELVMESQKRGSCLRGAGQAKHGERGDKGNVAKVKSGCAASSPVTSGRFAPPATEPIYRSSTLACWPPTSRLGRIGRRGIFDVVRANEIGGRRTPLEIKTSYGQQRTTS